MFSGPLHVSLLRLVPILILFLSSGAFAGRSVAAPQSRASEPVRVTVTCDRPDLVAGAQLRVLRRDPEIKGLRELPGPPTFDATGRAEAALGRGTYVFEVLAARDDGTVIALRSGSVSVPRVTEVKLGATAPQPVTITHAGQSLELWQLAVRSAGVIGEVRWKRPYLVSNPALVLSPGEDYRVNVIAASGPTHVAGWLKVSSGQSTAFQTDASWRECRFGWRKGTPPIRDAVATLVFPDTRMEVPITPETRVFTNRAWCMLEYVVNLEAGPRVQFRGMGYSVKRRHVFDVGGEIEPVAWAAWLWFQEEDLSWTPGFDWRLGLLDRGGHLINIYDKDAGIRWSIKRRDGEEVKGGRVDRGYVDKMGDLQQNLRVSVEWEWGGPQQRVITPHPWREVRSERFRIESAVMLPWQTRNYLTKLERYADIIRFTTGRPGPASFNIDFRANRYDARAIIGGAGGGAQWIWTSMPFRGYEDCWDPFSEVAFMGHELLHNFGYHHGEEMTRLENEVAFRFNTYRWHLVDHPSLEVPVVRPATYQDPKARRK